MEVLVYFLLVILFAILSLCFGKVAAMTIILAIPAGIIAVALFARLRTRLRFPGASAKADALSDDSAIVELARQFEQSLVAFECICDGSAQRVAVFSRTAHQLHSPIYRWIAKDNEAFVRARVSSAGIRTATADSEACGAWYIIHTDDRAPPIVWASHVKNSCALIEEQGHWVISDGRQRRTIAKTAIVGVEAWASDNWLRHEVRLHVQTQSGIDVIEVAHKFAWDAIGDPLYDGLEFLWDSSWAFGLGRQLAERLGLPLTCTGELKD